jgi:hypothetical protein
MNKHNHEAGSSHPHARGLLGASGNVYVHLNVTSAILSINSTSVFLTHMGIQPESWSFEII